jgi:hypothetical protein
VRPKPIQCGSKARLGVRPDVDAADTSASELMNSKIGVDADVFDDQHTQAVQLQVARHSCLTLDEWIRAARHHRAKRQQREAGRPDLGLYLFELLQAGG